MATQPRLNNPSTSSTTNQVLSSSWTVLSRAPIHDAIAARAPAASASDATMSQTTVPAKAPPLTVTTAGPPIVTTPPAIEATMAANATTRPTATARIAPTNRRVTVDFDIGSLLPGVTEASKSRTLSKHQRGPANEAEQGEDQRHSDGSRSRINRTLADRRTNDVGHSSSDAADRDDRPDDEHGEDDQHLSSWRPEQRHVGDSGAGGQRRREHAVELRAGGV